MVGENPVPGIFAVYGEENLFLQLLAPFAVDEGKRNEGFVYPSSEP